MLSKKYAIVLKEHPAEDADASDTGLTVLSGPAQSQVQILPSAPQTLLVSRCTKGCDGWVLIVIVGSGLG